MGTVETELGLTMNSLLVLSVVSMAAAAPQFFYPGHPLTYTYTPQVTKLVPKEVEAPVTHLTYGVRDTGCKNSFGAAVPCLTEGEARRKRLAEDAAEETEAAPAAAVVPLAYAGFGYGLAGYPYYAHPYTQVKVAEPEVTEVEVPHYVYKPVSRRSSSSLCATTDTASPCTVPKFHAGLCRKNTKQRRQQPPHQLRMCCGFFGQQIRQ